MPFVDGEYSPRSDSFGGGDDCRVSQAEIKSSVLINQLARAPEIGHGERLQSERTRQNIVEQIKLRLNAEFRANQVMR